jgi:hypothetical protein
MTAFETEHLLAELVLARRKWANANQAHGLKVLANATSYGIYAQMTRHELGGHRQEELRVFSDTEEAGRASRERRGCSNEGPCT